MQMRLPKTSLVLATITILLLSMNAAWAQFVPGSDNKVAFGGKYVIKSVGHGTVLDDWGGKVGKNSAALQHDNAPDSLNRTWTLVKAAQGFRIKSVGHGTVLDDWGGKVGENSAALQHDNAPDSLNRTWKLVKAAQGFRIKSVGHGTVLDDWGGKVGENSAALQRDNAPDSVNRTWIFVLQIKDPKVEISSFDFGDALTNLFKQGGTLDYALSETTTVKDVSLQTELSFSQSKKYSSSFTWGMSQKLGFEHTTKINCRFDFGGISGGAEKSFTVSEEFGSHQEWKTTKETTIASEVSYTPTKPGIYRIGRLVKQYENQKLPYRARLTLYGNDPGTDQAYSGDVLAAFLRAKGHDVVEVAAESATIIVHGSLAADFAVSSKTIVEKIGDVTQ